MGVSHFKQNCHVFQQGRVVTYSFQRWDRLHSLASSLSCESSVLRICSQHTPCDLALLSAQKTHRISCFPKPDAFLEALDLLCVPSACSAIS